MISSKIQLRDQFPSMCAAASLIVALLFFGADTTAFSLIVSALILMLTAVCALVFSDMRPTPFILFMFASWVIFTGISFAKGYTLGAEDHYLMSLSAISIFWLGQHGGLTSRGVEFAWRLFLIIGLSFSLFSFFQHVVSPSQILGIVKPYHTERLTGTFLSSNTTATFLGMVVLGSVAQIYRTWRLSYAKSYDSEARVFLDMIQGTVLPATTFLFSFVALLLTASRAGIAITLFTCFIFFLWGVSQLLYGKDALGNSKIGSALLISIALAAILALFWQVSGDRVSQRYETVFIDISDRANMLKASWNAFQYKPLFGHGLGSINEAKLLGVDPLSNSSVMAQNASHNIIAQTLVQSGIIGFVWLALIYLSTVYVITKGVFNNSKYTTYLFAILMMTVLVSVHGLFDYALEIPAVMLTHAWIVGLGFGLQMRHSNG